MCSLCLDHDVSLSPGPLLSLPRLRTEALGVVTLQWLFSGATGKSLKAIIWERDLGIYSVLNICFILEDGINSRQLIPIAFKVFSSLLILSSVNDPVVLGTLSMCSNRNNKP